MATTENVEIADIAVGDRIRFTPDSRERSWWEVIDRDEDHVVLIRQAPFQPKGIVEYTVTAVWDHVYNGAGPGLVRSSLNTLGGGWDLSNREGGAGAEDILDTLSSGEYQLSSRRVVGVGSIVRRVNAMNFSAELPMRMVTVDPPPR